MKRKLQLYCLSVVFALVSLTSISFAQELSDDFFCDGCFQEELYDYNMETVVYSDVYGRLMDIYTPVDNRNEPRPLILFAHGGAFVGGSKNTGSSEYFCKAFAKKGYVAASYNYQLANSLIDLADSTKMIEIVMKAISDGKAAIRYFTKDAATENTYNINPDLVFVGGNSAGAILSMNLAMIGNDGTDYPAHIAEAIDANGGLEGNSGNPGYSSEVAGVVNLAGGLNQLAFLDEQDVPFVSCHGDIDGVVPYDCQDVYWADTIMGLFDLVDICGSGALHPKADELGIQNALLTFEGDDHTPWSVDLSQGNALKMDQVIDFSTEFLYGLMQGLVSDVEDNVAEAIQVSLAPNPADQHINLQLKGAHFLQNIQLYDALGRLVYEKNGLFNNSFQIKRNQLAAGVYHLLIQTDVGSKSEKIVFK